MLLGAALVDALRSEGTERSSPAATTGTTANRRTPPSATRWSGAPTGGRALAPCTRDEIVGSLEIWGRMAVVGVQSLAGNRCRLPGLHAHLTIEDRGGNVVFRSGHPGKLIGAVLPGTDQSADLPLPARVTLCRRGGPYVARGSIGVHYALHQLSGSVIGCPSGDENAVRESRTEYVRRAEAICIAANDALDAYAREAFELDHHDLADLAAWSRAAARASEQAVTRLRALPRPTPGDANLGRLLRLIERHVDVLRGIGAAASAGERARATELSDDRIDLTHAKDGLAYELAERWGIVSTQELQSCPVSLPA